MTDTRAHDPFTDDQDRPCVCGGCGLVPVDEDYVNRHVARYASTHGNEVPAGYAAALRDSYRPCHGCRPDAYDDWRNGRYQHTTGSPARARGARRAYRGRRGGDR